MQISFTNFRYKLPTQVFKTRSFYEMKQSYGMFSSIDNKLSAVLMIHLFQEDGLKFAAVLSHM